MPVASNVPVTGSATFISTLAARGPGHATSRAVRPKGEIRRCAGGATEASSRVSVPSLTTTSPTSTARPDPAGAAAQRLRGFEHRHRYALLGERDVLLADNSRVVLTFAANVSLQ